MKKAIMIRKVSLTLAAVFAVCALFAAFFVYPAGRFAGLVVHLREAGLEPKTARPVYPKPGERASWVLVEAVCNGKEELSIEHPLFVEDAQGEYTEEMNRIFRWES